MRQRISILRGFVYPAKLLIMDEPFRSLIENTPLLDNNNSKKIELRKLMG